MFYITQDGQIYSGDCQNNDRELTADEVAIIKKGVFTVVNSKIVDSTTLPEYKINNKISEINHKLQDIQEKLDLLDLKSIRALREGGENSEGAGASQGCRQASGGEGNRRGCGAGRPQREL